MQKSIGKTTRMVVVAAVATAGLSACGGGAGSGTESDTAAAAATPESQIEAVFHGYYEAMLAGDFEGVCSFQSPEAVDHILANMERMGTKVSTCVEALEKSRENQANADAMDEIAATVEVKEIVVTGDTANVSWSSEVDGKRETTTTAVRRVDGEWRMDYTGS